MRTDVSRSVVFLIVGGPLYSPDRRSLRPVIDRLREVRRRHLREAGLQPSRLPLLRFQRRPGVCHGVP
jgi:hypothetical protein